MTIKTWVHRQLKRKFVWYVAVTTCIVLMYIIGLTGLLIWLSLMGHLDGRSGDLIRRDAPFPTPAVVEARGEPQQKEEPLDREGLVRARQIDESFQIDADLAGWAEIDTVSSAYQVYTAESWDGSNDGAAFWRTAWDADNLYLSAIVVDDLHIQGAESAVYRGDTLEVQIDTNVAADSVSPRTFTIVLSPGDFDQRAPYVACLRGTASGEMRAIAQHSTQIAVTQTETGYAVEAAIPWDDLGVKPSPNWMGRIALSMHDTDSAQRIRAEVIQSSVSERRADAPDSWGILLLTE